MLRKSQNVEQKNKKMKNRRKKYQKPGPGGPIFKQEFQKEQTVNVKEKKPLQN